MILIAATGDICRSNRSGSWGLRLFAPGTDSLGARSPGWHDGCDRLRPRGRVLPGMVGFEVTTSEEAGGVRVTLAGECDMAVSDRLQTSLMAAIQRSPM